MFFFYKTWDFKKKLNSSKNYKRKSLKFNIKNYEKFPFLTPRIHYLWSTLKHFIPHIPAIWSTNIPKIKKRFKFEKPTFILIIIIFNDHHQLFVNIIVIIICIFFSSFFQLEPGLILLYFLFWRDEINCSFFSNSKFLPIKMKNMHNL